MKHAASPKMHTNTQQDAFGTRVQIYKDIADVTWRMFVPSIGGCVLGVLADRAFGTKPWLTLTGVCLGFAIVGFLIWRQLRTVRGRVS